MQVRQVRVLEVLEEEVLSAEKIQRDTSALMVFSSWFYHEGTTGQNSLD